jgi:hypothetical protein
MATQYGVDATTLSAPQGAGTQPLAPVETPRPINPLSGLMAVGEIFAKGLAADTKAQAQKRADAIIGQYVESENTISNAIAQGRMSPAEAAARSRANFRKFSSGYPEYITDLEKAGKALRGFTEAGVVEDTIKRATDERAADKTRASGRGFMFYEGMSKEAEDATIKASQAGITAERTMGQFYQAQSEARAQGTYDAGVAAKEEKDQSFKVINMVAGENLNAFQTFGLDLADKVRSGVLKPQDAKGLLARNYGNISAAIQASARVNPELAAPYRSIFESMYQTSQAMLDPSKVTDELKNEFEAQKLRLKLVAMNDPVAAAGIVTNELFANNPAIALSVSDTSVRTFTRLSSTAVGAKNPDGTNVFVPQVVGNPEVEADTLKLLKSGLSDLQSGKIKKADVAKVQALNSVNQILKQTGELINRGADPQSLKGVANFFASSEYAAFVADGKIDKQAAGTAYRTFQVLYEPTIVKGVQAKLNTNLDKNLATFGGPKSKEVTKDTPLADVVNVKFTGSGIYFEPKSVDKLSSSEQRSASEMIPQLNSSQKAINQLIHIAAHMEGSTDYGKFWEENKHIWLPSIFSAPEVKPSKQGSVSTESSMRTAVADLPTPAQALISNANPKDIAELEKEIARTSNPMAKKVLEDYLATVKGN